MISNQKRLVIVVPVHNEEPNIDSLAQRIFQATRDLKTWRTEILFVDDGSTDGSLRKIQSLRSSGLAVGYLSFFRNFGHQAALLAGLEHVQGDAVVTMDGDLQHPPEDIPRMIESFEGGSEIVQMVREQRVAGSKGVLSSLFYRVFAAASGTAEQPEASDFRLVSRKVIELLRSTPERSKFLRAYIPSLGFPMTTLTYKESPRKAGKPSYGVAESFKLANQALFDFSTVPLRFVFWFGMTLAFLSFCFGIGHVVVKVIAWESIAPGFTDIIASILFLSGCILALLGIVSRYLILILEQLRGRPVYILKEKMLPQVRDQEHDVPAYESTAGKR